MPNTASETTGAAAVHPPGETIGRVAAGAVAMKLLAECGIEICAYSKAIGPVSIDPAKFNAEEIFNNPVYMPDADAASEAEAFIAEQMKKQDSCGGIIECMYHGMPAGTVSGF